MWKISAVARDLERVSFSEIIVEDRRQLAAHYRAILSKLGLSVRAEFVEAVR